MFRNVQFRFNTRSIPVRVGSHGDTGARLKKREILKRSSTDKICKVRVDKNLRHGGRINKIPDSPRRRVNLRHPLQPIPPRQMPRLARRNTNNAVLVLPHENLQRKINPRRRIPLHERRADVRVTKNNQPRRRQLPTGVLPVINRERDVRGRFLDGGYKTRPRFLEGGPAPDGENPRPTCELRQRARIRPRSRRFDASSRRCDGRKRAGDLRQLRNRPRPVARGDVRSRVVRYERPLAPAIHVDFLREVEAGRAGGSHDRRAEGGVPEDDHAVRRQRQAGGGCGGRVVDRCDDADGGVRVQCGLQRGPGCGKGTGAAEDDEALPVHARRARRAVAGCVGGGYM